MARFIVLFCHMPKGTEENQERISVMIVPAVILPIHLPDTSKALITMFTAS
jgi:hypothetical protein